MSRIGLEAPIRRISERENTRNAWRRVRNRRKKLKSMTVIGKSHVICLKKHRHNVQFVRGSLIVPHAPDEFLIDKVFRRLGPRQMKAFRCHNLVLEWRGKRNKWGGTKTDYRSIPEDLRHIRETGWQITRARATFHRCLSQLNDWTGNGDILTAQKEKRAQLRMVSTARVLLERYTKQVNLGSRPAKRGKRTVQEFKVSWDPQERGHVYNHLSLWRKAATIIFQASLFWDVHKAGIAIATHSTEGKVLVLEIKSRKDKVFKVEALYQWMKEEYGWDSTGSYSPTGKKRLDLEFRAATVTLENGTPMLKWTTK